MARVDPVTSLWRAGLVFLLGWVFTQVWYVFFTVRVHSSGGDYTDNPAPNANPGEN